MAEGEFKYRTICDTLKSEILGGRYSSGRCFPSEAQLVRRFGGSRITAGGDSSLVLRYAATVGMAPILAAKKCLLLACFVEQAAPMKAIIAKGCSTPFLSASYLWKHPDFRLIYTMDKMLNVAVEET